MKKIPAFLLGCFLLFTAAAQSTIKGKVLDEKQNPVKGAVILLLQQKDSSLVLSALSAENGEYSLEKVGNGTYQLSVSLLGYKKITQPVTVAGTAVTLPDTKLVTDAVTLKEVVVTSTKPFLEQRADKLVVNVEGSATAAGSTAMEVLQKVPGVIVSNDQVKLAGKSSVNILIDGRSSQYTDMSQVLTHLSASNIEKIELITNPGAKYDAAGGAIINIILKKNANLGTNGSINLGTSKGLYEKGKDGLDRDYYRFTPSVSLNHRKGKLNVYGSLSALNRNAFNNSEFDRVIGGSRFFQTNYSPGDRHSNNYRVGIDFYADKKNTFGILLRGFNRISLSETVNTTQQTAVTSGTLLSTFTTLIHSKDETHNISANANWKHVFDSLGRELNIDFDYSDFRINNTSDITTKLSGSSYLNNQRVNNPVNFGVFKLDYTHPFNKNTKLELGAKTSMATIDNYLVFSKANIPDPARSADFEYKENINSLYSSFQAKLEGWELIAGLRAEQTVAKGKTATASVLNRNYWQLFPSAFLTRKITKDLSTILQYSRRVNRPSYQQQNPFIQYLDSLTYTRGNPLIRPELSDSYKFSVTYQNQPFFSVSYNRTKDVIFNDAPKQEGNLTYTTPENLAAYENMVFELNFPIEFGKKISGYGGNQFIYNHYKADYLGGMYNRHKWNWQAYWQVSYKPTPVWNFEVSGFYTTAMLEEFIDIGEMSGVNFAIQRSFLSKKLRIGLNFSDVFYSTITRGAIVYQDINVAFRQWGESRNVRLSVSYSFGNQKLAAARNRSTGSDSETNRVKAN